MKQWELLLEKEDEDNLFQHKFIVQEFTDTGNIDAHCCTYAFETQEEAISWGKHLSGINRRVAVYEEIAASIGA